MRSYRIGLVQISDVVGKNIILPLAIGTLWTNYDSRTEIKGKWSLQKIIYHNDFTQQDIKDIASCDMVCFSTYVWNADYHVNIASKIKNINPDCYVVVGGPNYSSNHRDFWDQYQDIFDLVMLGEGETSFQKLLSCWPDREKISSIPGAWMPAISNPTTAQRIVDTESLHSPYLSGFYDDMVYYIHSNEYLLQVVLQTNRGCPYHCTFCEEGTDYHNKIYVMHIDRIMREIEWCGINRVEYLTMADDNFGILSRDIDIMEKLCQTKKNYGYPKILDSTWAKNNPKNILAMVELDKKYGTDLIRSITVALQSENKQTLIAIQRFNLSKPKHREFIKELKKHNVTCYAEVIWPLPFETYDTLCLGFDSILEQGVDNWIGMYPLGLFQSASLYHDFRDYYQVAQVKDANNGNRAYIVKSLAIASNWADHDAVVRGHAFYIWTTGLYFFGFARPILDALRIYKNWSVSRSINEFIYHVEKETTAVSKQHHKIKEFYHNWLVNNSVDNLNQFPDKDVSFWYPFTHHASWLQLNHDALIDTLHSWAEQYLDAPRSVVESCRDSTVRYGQSYPYTSNGHVISLNHAQPNFADLHEFCRFYYWWKRKNGCSRTCWVDQKMPVMPRLV